MTSGVFAVGIGCVIVLCAVCAIVLMSSSHYQRVNDAIERAAAREGAHCEICSGAAVYLCGKCWTPIADHSHENDYICHVHGFINPVRQSDGACISGDGHVHPPAVMV